MDVLHGKLAHFNQHAPPMNLFTSEVLLFLKSLIEESENNASRDQVALEVPPLLKHDLKTITAIVRSTLDTPLPILEAAKQASVDALKIWTDASGHLIASPSLGIFIPSILGEPPFVASLAFPRHFLQAEDVHGHKSFCKTTTLECLGLLGALCADPMRFAGKEAVFHIDNLASVFLFKKGHCRDEWATTVVRAARVVAAGIGCTLFVEWERRCSSRESIIADNLTHNLLEGLNDRELESYLSYGTVSFEEPILQWMARPKKGPGLGRTIFIWLREQYLGLDMLRSK